MTLPFGAAIVEPCRLKFLNNECEGSERSLTDFTHPIF